MKVTIEEAVKLQQEARYKIHWRPEPNLPESEQYALIEEVE